jgi:membrane protein DedA with SNARE-associated domain
VLRKRYSAVHFSPDVLTHLLDTWGYLAVFLFVAIESMGIPFPGETMLVTAGVYASTGHLKIQLVIAAAALGAIVGDNLGYLVGRRGGRPFLLRFGKYLHLDEARLARGQEFFERYGDRAVFFGRFVAVLRAWAAFLAGVNEMPYPKFFFFNAAGGIIWATLYGTLAYLLGKNLPLLERVVRGLGIGSVVLAASIAVVIYLSYRRGRRLQRRAVGSASPSSSESPSEPSSGTEAS